MSVVKKVKAKLKGVHSYLFLDDYNFLKDYCDKSGQRGDYSHIIRTAVHNAVINLKKIQKEIV